jgi:class 3 adenylate cyclase
MVDIKRYTSLSRQLDTNSLSLKIGTWLRHNRDAIESAGGVVDKFLGDAIFAYWKNNAEAPALVSRALQQLMVLQQQRDPDFRIVLHHAATTLEGGAGGANNLSGPEIIYTFRLEKVCSGLGTDTIVSSAAAAVLPAPWTCESMGRHPLDGFPGTHEVFQLVT